MKKKHWRNLYSTIFGVCITGVVSIFILLLLNEHPLRKFELYIGAGFLSLISLICIILFRRSFKISEPHDQDSMSIEELSENNTNNHDITDEQQIEKAEKPKKRNKRDYGLLIVIVINIITITILFITYKFIIQSDCPPCPNETETQIQDDSDIDTTEDTSDVINGIGGKTTTLGPDTLTPELPQFVFLLVGTAHSDTGSADWYKDIITGIRSMRNLESATPRIRLSSDYLFFDTVPHTKEESRRYTIYDKAIFHNQDAQIVEVKRGLLSNGRFNYFAKLKFE